ncbi:hypothetical protein Tco_0585274 [Tanacetum coccineum]
MTKLTQKSVKFNWGEKEETAFRTLKQIVVSVAPLLGLRSENLRISKSMRRNYLTHDSGIGSCGVDFSRCGDIIFTTRIDGVELLSGLTTVEAKKEENYGTEDLYGMIKNLEPRPDGTLCLKELEILATPKVGTIAYQRELPEKLSHVHSTFHVSNLKKCLSDEPLAIPLDEIHVDDKLNFIEEPIENYGSAKLNIMAASAIAISFDSSDESVGSPPSRLILFGDIPTVIPSTSVVAPGTSTIALVISSAALVMSSPEHISPLLAISPFLCTNSSEALDSSDGPPSHDPYVATVARWRSRVTARPSSIILSSYCSCNGPTEIHRRHALPRSSEHRSSSSSSSSDSSPVHSSGLDETLQRSKAFRRWCAAPLSTLYPPTTSESSSGDSSKRPLRSSLHSARPSRKRCRSSVDSIPSFMPVMGSLAPTRTDLLPPCKRFRDSYSFEASVEEDTEIDPIETEVDMELGISDRDDF